MTEALTTTTMLTTTMRGGGGSTMTETGDTILSAWRTQQGTKITPGDACNTHSCFLTRTSRDVGIFKHMEILKIELC